MNRFELNYKHAPLTFKLSIFIQGKLYELDYLNNTSIMGDHWFIWDNYKKNSICSYRSNGYRYIVYEERKNT